MDDILRVNKKRIQKKVCFDSETSLSGGFQIYITWKSNQRASGRDKSCHAHVAAGKT